MPLRLAPGHQIHAASRERTWGHVTDVVHAWIPNVATASKGVQEPTEFEMRFEHQHALPTDLSEKTGGGQSPHPRADDDCVEVASHAG